MDVKKSKKLKNFISIEYPGHVVNDDKMIESLGGIEELSKGFQDKQKLQLKFRQNLYAKPALSTEQQESTGLVMKVKVRKSKRHRDKKPEIISTELLGTVTAGYKFTNFADYQFLPIQRNEKTGKTENIYDDIVPKDITVGPAWFRENSSVPVFLPPVGFTRNDAMQPTSLKNEKLITKAEDGEENVSFAVTNRQSRATNGVSVLFDLNEPVPTKPSDAVKDLVQNKVVTQEEYDEVIKLFNDRPIWTLASLRAYIRQPSRRLNFVLATIAFYYSTGPWRNCFVRFGYDPRTSFDSRFFQMLDYRVRHGGGFKGDVNWRRQTGTNKRVKVLAKFESGIPNEDEIEESFQKRKLEAIFTPSTIPPFRARHYQFIDIHIPKIQEMLHKATFSGGPCHDKRGWLPDGLMEQCRDILTVIAQTNMQKLCSEKNISLQEYKDAEVKSETPIDGSDAEEIDSDVDREQDENDVE